MTDARSTAVKAMIREVVAAFSAELGQARVVIFGSRAAGLARERSDFDVAIEGHGPVDVRVLAKLRQAIDELPTLYQVDLVDLALVAPTVRVEMLRHVEVIL